VIEFIGYATCFFI